VNDVTGMPQTAVVIGGGSDLALAVMRRLASRRLRALVLVGRDIARLDQAAKELSDLGVKSVATLVSDVCDAGGHEALAHDCEQLLGSVDLVVVAAGSLGSAELDALRAEDVARSIETNFAGPAAAITAFATLMRAQGYGRIVVFSSVAGVRVRAANFVYGAGKAGLDAFCQGLGDALAGSGVQVVIVRPGFVRTKMTAGLSPAPFAVDGDAVAEAVVRGLERGSPVIWVPAALRVVFAALRLLPQAVWRRLPG
jgi:decaprenylphospho-beta-D-erythro-pentofuranosid-2-ulose 2-reductase